MLASVLTSPMAAILEHNCSIVSGGGLEEDKEWIIRPSSWEEVNDKKFITVGRSNLSFAQFVSHDFVMMDRIMELRNKACDSALHQAQVAQGNVDPLSGKVTPVKKRKEAFETIPGQEVIELRIDLADGSQVMYVKSMHTLCFVKFGL